jgi:hypothetical protein
MESNQDGERNGSKNSCQIHRGEMWKLKDANLEPPVTIATLRTSFEGCTFPDTGAILAI